MKIIENECYFGQSVKRYLVSYDVSEKFRHFLFVFRFLRFFFLIRFFSVRLSCKVFPYIFYHALHHNENMCLNVCDCVKLKSCLFFFLTTLVVWCVSAEDSLHACAQDRR